MNQPGVWILGDTDDAMRRSGLGVVIEYANRQGPAQWQAPGNTAWDYTLFGATTAKPPPNWMCDNSTGLQIEVRAGNRWVDHWTINGKEFPKTDPIPGQGESADTA